MKTAPLANTAPAAQTAMEAALQSAGVDTAAPAATPEEVVENEENVNPPVDETEIVDTDEKPVEYHSHEEKQNKEKKESRGREKGAVYTIRQNVGSILRKCPVLKNFPRLISKRVQNTPEEITANLGAAIADGRFAAHMEAGTSDKFLASLATKETGGKFKLSQVAEKFGDDYVLEISRREMIEWVTVQMVGCFENLKTINADEVIDEDTGATRGVFTAENDPTIVREETETVPAAAE